MIPGSTTQSLSSKLPGGWDAWRPEGCLRKSNGLNRSKLLACTIVFFASRLPGFRAFPQTP